MTNSSTSSWRTKLLKIKTGVKPIILLIAAAVSNASEEFGFDPVITSGNDGVHMKGSKHYTFEALDIRTSNIPKGKVQPFIAALFKRLGSDFDIVLERDHIHCEYDPDVI